MTPNDAIHIDYNTGLDTQEDFILWGDIQQVFEEALFIRQRTKMVPFVKGSDYRPISSLRFRGSDKRLCTPFPTITITPLANYSGARVLTCFGDRTSTYFGLRARTMVAVFNCRQRLLQTK
ncbi:hypothetical protein BGW39_005724 [Mortierella sp. 14UC]|nr:hypothetical protein BGW39_005724 [Mortierella sp. 14UC]